MEACERIRLTNVTAQFPQGCTVRRKVGAKITEATRPETAVVDIVVMTGIHRDIVIKTAGMVPKYLDPDQYEVVTNPA